MTQSFAEEQGFAESAYSTCFLHEDKREVFTELLGGKRKNEAKFRREKKSKL
jgi:hypothetical protein